MSPITFLPLASGYAEVPGHHRSLLDDRVRTNAFRRAIARVVREGDVVADLGTGTGILAMEARRRGALRVYAIERNAIVKVAARIARANDTDGITFLEGHSREVVLPEPIDVLVSECLGTFGIGGTMVQAVTELRERHLRPGGSVIPSALSLYLAPIESAAEHAYIAAWERPRYGYRWNAAANLAWNNVYSTLFEPRTLLCSKPPELARIDLTTGRFDGRVKSTIAITPSRAGVLHGFCGYFTAHLCEGVRLSTAPGRPPTVWRHAFFPLRKPLRVTKRSRITVTFESVPAAIAGHILYFDWSGDVDGEAFSASTRHSYPG